MGISFKVSKTGKRFYPKSLPASAAAFTADEDQSYDVAIAVSKKKSDVIALSARKFAGEDRENQGIAKIPNKEVSFTLSLFLDGYSIGKPLENECGNRNSTQIPKFLRPYDRSSESLFSAIELGRLPGDILDDIPCKYVDGTLVCEVRDYRKCFSEGLNVASGDNLPIIDRVSLKMSLENIVNDIPAISDNSWTYGDMMEVESRILKAIQPQLCLDPTPQLDKLSEYPVPCKLNLELRSMRRKRLRQIPEVAVSSNDINGKKVCLDRAPESSSFGETGSLVQQPAYENLNSQKYVASTMLPLRNNSFGPDGSRVPSHLASHQSKYIGVGSPRMTKDHRSGALMNASVSSPGGQEMMIPFTDNVTTSIHGKTENQDGLSSPLTNKKARLMHTGADGNVQHLGPQIDTLLGSELHWKNTLMQQQPIGGGIQYANGGMQKFSQKVFEGGLNQEGGSTSFTVGQQGLVSSQKEKSAVTSVPSFAVGANPSFTSSANDSMQSQNQAQAAGKRPITPVISGVGSPASVGNISIPINANSPPVGAQHLGDQTMLERFSKIEMVAMRCQLNCKKNKVDEYPMRKPNTYSAQQLMSHLSSDSNNENLKDETCKMPLSKSIVGGNMNVCKTRILNFTPTERIIQGNSFQFIQKASTRMIMSEKPNDGAVAIHIGEIKDAEYLAAEDYLPALPNTNIADLLAAQYCSLMIREGYNVEDLVQPKPVLMNPTSVGQLNASGVPPGGATSEMQQFSERVSMQPSGDNARPSNSSNAPVNLSQNVQAPRILPPGSTQAIQMSPGLLPGVSVPSRPQQFEQLPPMQQQPQQQQHHPQFQRSPVMLPANTMQHLNNIAQNANVQLLPHMTNKSSALQLQLLQQQNQQPQLQPQQQQQPAMQRKIMSGLGTVGMGNIGNNMVGLGGLGNVMGIGGARGVGGSGISAPMGSIPSVGNMNQNPVNLSSASNISNAIRSGTLTQAQATFLKMTMVKNGSNILGNSQSGIGGMPGARQMHPGSAGLSMLGPALTRVNANQMQRTTMGQMGPPKLMPGMNLYMNQQQQQQLQQQQQQQHFQQQQLHLHQQQQMQLQQQQQETSPLQAVVSPQQMGSPSSMGIPQQTNPQHKQQQQQQQPQQQQTSPHQMSQRTPMSPQLSSGTIHPMAAANPEACPASPQLSSQTLGSVGSLTNSPMELQGLNKSNSVSNA